MNTRRPAAAGTFYPSDPEQLRKTVKDILGGATPPVPDGEVLAIMAPHAGYDYSAAVAAPAYLAMGKADFDTAVIIGHDFGRQAGDIIAILDEHDAFDTPLGPVLVDTALERRLRAILPQVIAHNGVHGREHSIEVHLPFLKTLKPGTKIVPVLFGEATPEHCTAFAEALAKAAGDTKILILASTDLSHYPSGNDARELDAETTSFIENMNLPGLCKRQAGKGIHAPNVQTPICSAGGVGVAIAWCNLKGGAKATILKRANSGDVSGDNESVVGYASAMFVQAHGTGTRKTSQTDTAQAQPVFSLPANAQAELLSLARRRIAAHLADKKWSYTPPEDIPELKMHAPAFVTLTKNGRLRGCIGYIVARGELWRAVEEMAFAAAFQDNRFPQLAPGELDSIRIEISVLSPMTDAKPEQIVPFKHGVVVRRGRRSGLFLPQVWEQLPDKEQFMAYLCLEKAGLPADAWKQPDTSLQIFTVFAFEEKQ